MKVKRADPSHQDFQNAQGMQELFNGPNVLVPEKNIWLEQKHVFLFLYTFKPTYRLKIVHSSPIERIILDSYFEHN